MNSPVQLIFVALLSIAIDNGNTQSLDYWYTGKDLNCTIYSDRSNERPFVIRVYPLWQNVRNEYCENKRGKVIKIDKTTEHKNQCKEPNLRTLEMNSGYLTSA